MTAAGLVVAIGGEGVVQSTEHGLNQLPSYQGGAVYQMPAIVVTATRQLEEPISLPYSVNLVSPADMDRMLPQTTPEATYFYTLIDEMIVRVPTGQVTPDGAMIVSKQNSGEGYVHGVQLQASVKVHRDWTLWAAFSWMRGELETPIAAGGTKVTEPISRLMPTTVNSGLRWNDPKRRFWAEFATTFAERQDRLASNDIRDTQRIPPGGTPGYGVYHLRAGWNPCSYATISAALENLTDENYRIHGSGSNEPGRNFIVMAQLRY